ncbi:hypothetical protein [Actinomadura macrotermitis]|nr:hypothetical protein [Actinomadura macrotermitis]
MLAGAALQVLGVIVAFLNVDATRDAIKEQIAKAGSRPSETLIDGFAYGVAGLAAVFGLVAAGLWIWMAFMNRAGRNWARITASVLFALFCSGTASGGPVFMNGTVNGFSFHITAGGTPGLLVDLTICLIGLGTVILLWLKPSSAFFNPARSPQAPFRPPYGPPPYGSPPNAPGPSSFPRPPTGPSH